jgi:hypothetical protein
MESLYPSDHQRLQSWDEGQPMEEATHKHNELVLPDGRRP